MSAADRKRSKGVGSEAGRKKSKKVQPPTTVRQHLAFLVNHVYFALAGLKFIDPKLPIIKFRSILDKDAELIAFFDKCINGDNDDLNRFYRIEWPDKFDSTEDDDNPAVLTKLYTLRKESGELKNLLDVYGDARTDLRAKCIAFSK